MKKVLHLVIIFPVLFLIACQNQDYELATKKTDILINAFLEKANIPGMAVAISKDGKLIYTNSFGFSDLEQKLPTTNNTKFRIGSVTKLLTAVSAVKLIENGIIKKNDPIKDYINDLQASYQNISIAQLAGHLSGIRHYTKEEIYSTNTKNYSNLKDALEKFINDTLLFTPGEKYKYSSYGYVLLGAVLESVEKKHFADIISKYILQPAGLVNTLPERYNAEVENLSKFYLPRNDGEGFTIPEAENYSYKLSAGAYLSTATDLALFGSALLSGKIIDTMYLPLLFNPLKKNDGTENRCGFGFRIDYDRKGRKVVHHGGESEGARAFFLIYPEQKLTIALLANVFRAPIFEGEAETIAGYFLNDFRSQENMTDDTIKFSTNYNGRISNGEINFNTKTISGFGNSDMSIVDIVREDDKMRLITIASSGIINFWISKINGHLIGKWGYDKEKTELKFE